MRSLKYVSSFIVGFAVGAGVTLLFAPMTGKKMQKKIARIGDQLVDKVDEVKVAVSRLAS
jgi:gas vesicle protein